MIVKDDAFYAEIPEDVMNKIMILGKKKGLPFREMLTHVVYDYWDRNETKDKKFDPVEFLENWDPVHVEPPVKSERFMQPASDDVSGRHRFWPHVFSGRRTGTAPAPDEPPPHIAPYSVEDFDNKGDAAGGSSI